VIQTSVEITDRIRQPGAQELRLRSGDLVPLLGAGQAVLLKGAWGAGACLRRPFYPSAIAVDSFLIRVPPSADYAHAWLCTAPLGTQLDALGPVGSGYHLSLGARNILGVGQDASAWALLPILDLAGSRGAAVTLAAEAMTARNAIPASRLPPYVEYQVSTIDGSLGSQGTVQSLLPDLLNWADLILAAGSLAFYRRLGSMIQAARFQVRRGFCQALVEAPLLCGVGSCRSCATDLAVGQRLACTGGPVFDLVDVAGSGQ
jgi:NAD(P)H-flavin reductase